MTKLNPTGSALVYSTFLGPSAQAFGIAVDTSGNAYVTGFTFANFPTTVDRLQAFGRGSEEVFVANLNTNGSSALLYSTFLGGSSSDRGFRIALDRHRNAYVTGVTASTNFPTTSGAFQTTSGSGSSFAAKIATLDNCDPNDQGDCDAAKDESQPDN